jgi:hypothetical protein
VKIEIGESLVYSWLRHVKKCQIVQTNWKPSPRWEKNNIDFEAVNKDINSEFNNFDLDIFKKNSSMDQFFRQAEIDVFGFSNNPENNHPEYYLVDIAFHEGGLNYGNTNETISRVLKKYIRSYFIFKTYFGKAEDGTIIFMSPKVSLEKIEIPLNDNIIKLKEILLKHDFDPNLQLVVNQKFNDIVLTPTLILSSEIADTNELFLRSVQLWKMFDGTKIPTKRETKQSNVREVKEEKKVIPHDTFENIDRIERWANHPNQINHKIVKAYLKLNRNGAVILENLRRLCSDPTSEYFVKNFRENYASMKTDSGNNHGKVFYDDGEIVSIYPPVLIEIKRWFN